ncbi:hypothetical protein Pcac1_g18388 [Phytophthora cactorum]|nr:hypothetical protein Pcac1_g18388 [Phytophthora cactorum]
MSELVSNEVAIVHERGSQDVRGAARYPQSGAGLVSDPLLCPDEDVRGVARNPLSGTELDNDLPLRAPESRRGVARNPPSGVGQVMDRMALSCVSRETRTPRCGLPVTWHLGAATVVSPRDLIRPVSVAEGEEEGDETQGVCDVEDVGRGEVDGDISLDSLPAVNALLELDEMSIAEYGEALKAGDLAEVVALRPEEELNSSSVVDEAEYTDVVSKNPPMGLPPD